MSTKIKKLTIDNLFGYTNIDWELKDVNVLVGKNGLGKSTILRLISTALTQEPIDDELKLCDKVNVEFDNGDSTFATSKFNLPDDIFKKALKEFIDSNELEKQLLNKLEKSQRKNFALLKDKIRLELTQNLAKQDLNLDKIESYQFKKNKNKYNTEFISTVNMSANSINSIRTSDGRISNFLDFEIKNELERLLSKNASLQEDLIDSLNFFFKESQKTVEILDNNLIINLKNSESIKYKNLSSGERQIIYIFLKVINANTNNSIILMDEPEISLHLSWQESLLSQIRKVNKNSQIIIVTHSPAIVMNGWMDSFIDIKDIISES
ncbi:ATP-binding protein [Acinetobacter puyangensis]|uniref:Predicted ATP-binding protein involved in virulence n=1 Tax=Acinetobacter puyangensis TaxID=1096779 RepID=A0A240E8P3_9GAMM|nr:ATP-binding protein [Acinetobacter puyangensis]SNX44250.1 Predicted ATP-binding protein involved in virulence [Acinetobacter puyangensis]